jgi:hypothetical protein
MKTLMAALVFIAAPVAIASAQPGGGGMLERLRAVDLNGDGAITKVEARTARETAFRALDTNNDGFVTDAEKAATRDGAAKKRGGGGPNGGGGDTNGDGKISRDEFMNAPYRAFDRLDANNNDIIDASELESARTMLMQRKQGTP